MTSEQSETPTQRLKLWFALMMIAAVAPGASMLLDGVFIEESVLVGMMALAVAIAGYARAASEVY